MEHSNVSQRRSEMSREQKEQERELHREIRPQLALASLGALLVGVAYLLLPDTLTVGPNWLVLAVEAVVLVPLTAAAYFRPHTIPFPLARRIRTSLLVVLTLALLSSIALLVGALPGYGPERGRQLLQPAVLLWLSNILIFADWYWELDGGGPAQRHWHGRQVGDFLFPQYTMQTVPVLVSPSPPSPPSPPSSQAQARGRAEGSARRGGHQRWMPGFIDYVFLAFCFATALSPADTAPLTPRAKLLMMAEALFSLTIAALLIARSINIL
ncbi:MAG TPA: hypothetical protein VFN11_14805 [Ktedonobacterales bacterium]|nr:hypothetical protein [Ktedonobacterales bacterium]